MQFVMIYILLFYDERTYTTTYTKLLILYSKLQKCVFLISKTLFL